MAAQELQEERKFIRESIAPSKDIGEPLTPTTFLNQEPDVIAMQMSILEFRIYKAIQPTELLGKVWSDTKTRNKSPNVSKMTDRFNTIARWVQSCILWETTLKARAKVYTKFLGLMVVRANFVCCL